MARRRGAGADPRPSAAARKPASTAWRWSAGVIRAAISRPVRIRVGLSADASTSPPSRATAREELRRRAKGRGLALQVGSRGVHPEDHVSPALAARLRADGIDPNADPLRPLTPSDIAQADVLVAFDEAAQAPGLEGARAW